MNWLQTCSHRAEHASASASWRRAETAPTMGWSQFECECLSEKNGNKSMQ